MALPTLSASTTEHPRASFGNLLGSSFEDAPAAREDGPLPRQKVKIGEEFQTQRAGSPAFQDGHWVTARPKLVTPTTNQRPRRLASDHGTVGLGETSPQGVRMSRGIIHSRGSTQSIIPRARSHGRESIGPKGDVRAWGQEYDNGEILPDQEVTDDCWAGGQEEDEEEGRPYLVDNPALDAVQPYVDDLYFATARPRFEVDPVYLRRQRRDASVAAGALTNILRMIDHRTNRPPQPTDEVGQERAEILESAARFLMSFLKLQRSSEGGFPDAVVTKAAAALQKAITFRDVRARIADVTPLAVVSLVELLRQEAYEDTGNGARDREKCQKDKTFHEKIEATELLAPGQMALHAAACLRVLALNEGFPEKLASSCAIPALVDGLRQRRSPLMKTICGGCLARIALSDDEACANIVDFGAMLPIFELIRSGNLVHELTAWGVLGGILRAPEARREFARAEGLRDLEAIITRPWPERNIKDRVSRLLPACQESAMQVLALLCEKEEDGEEDEELDAKRVGNDQRLRRLPSGTLIVGGPDDDIKTDTYGGCSMRTSHSSEALSDFDGGGYGGGCYYGEAEVDKTNGDVLRFNLGEFVSQEAVFGAVLNQMTRKGTYAAATAATQVLIHTWRACSRDQVDATIPAVVEMLASNVWMLKSAAAQIILRVYLEDEQRVACATSGGLLSLVNMLHIKGQPLQGGTLAALLSLCEHPDVPGLLATERDLMILMEYLTTSRDVATRYVVLAIMKVILVCEISAVEPFLPDVLVSEHVLGVSDEVEAFVEAFIKKRKATDYLRVGADNLWRFAPTEIAAYKEAFKELDKDASGTLDEEEFHKLLKGLKVGSMKERVRKMIAGANKKRSGVIEFDEFLDRVWYIKHATGSERGGLRRRAKVLLWDALAAARAGVLEARARHGTLPGKVPITAEQDGR